MAEIVTLTPNPAIDLSTSVDRVVPMRKLRCAPPRRDPGGGGVNVARVVKRFGGDVEAILPVGRLHRPIAAPPDRRRGNTQPRHRSRGRNPRRFFRLRAEHGAAIPLRPARASVARNGMACVPRSAGRHDTARRNSSWAAAACRPPCRMISMRRPPRSRASSAPNLSSIPPARRSPRRIEHGVYMIKPNLREMRDLVWRGTPARRRTGSSRRANISMPERSRSSRCRSAISARCSSRGTGVAGAGAADQAGQRRRRRRQFSRRDGVQPGQGR